MTVGKYANLALLAAVYICDPWQHKRIAQVRFLIRNLPMVPITGHTRIQQSWGNPQQRWLQYCTFCPPQVLMIENGIILLLVTRTLIESGQFKTYSYHYHYFIFLWFKKNDHRRTQTTVIYLFSSLQNVNTECRYFHYIMIYVSYFLFYFLSFMFPFIRKFEWFPKDIAHRILYNFR